MLSYKERAEAGRRRFGGGRSFSFPTPVSNRRIGP